MTVQDETRKNNPRKHHFLPASYLRNFSSPEERLYVYEREKAPRASAAHAEAYIRDFYAYDGEGGKSFEIEEMLSRYESQAAPVIQGIIYREANREHRFLTVEETKIVTHFAALTFVRVPAGRRLDENYVAPAVARIFKEAAPSKERFAALVKDIPDEEPLSEEERMLRIEDARLKILNGYCDLPEPPGMRLYAMLHVAEMIANELAKYSCMIVTAPKHESFITGDTPVVNLTERNGMTQLGTSFDGKDNTVWFPVGSKVCLLWRRDIDPSYGKLPPRGVRMVNRNIMRYAERFIYAATYSEKLAATFATIKQEIFLGENAYIPVWEGRPVLHD